MTKKQQGQERCSIVTLSNDEAQEFLLGHDSYCTIDLPPYFTFECLLSEVSQVLKGSPLSDLRCQTPRRLDDVNHLIMNNKDGRYAWRPLELAHPALYVSLVNKITEVDYWGDICERFRVFDGDPKIRCMSLPVKSFTIEKDKGEQVKKWWRDIEQESIELSLDYEYLIHTDIVDCYAAIYTHSISWALHTKPVAKTERNNSELIGNIIDWHIQDMRNGQTNGIPQGSILMDFIAEIVLGYADTELSIKLKDQEIGEFQILRYRDDYRIFVNNSQDGERILKSLTEVMIDLGLKLKPEKTRASSEVISSSIKEDKLDWLFRKTGNKSLQKHLLIIHDHSMRYPNGGSLKRALHDFNESIKNLNTCDFPIPLISIVVDIACRCPQTYTICAGILSKLIRFLDEDLQGSVIERTRQKFSAIPNTGHMEIWIQRFSRGFDSEFDYKEPLCHLVRQENSVVWNNDWISSKDLLNALDPRTMVDIDMFETIPLIIQPEEIRLFNPFYPW